MGENTKIEWCDHTFNYWIGCTNVSPACDHCYAEAWVTRFGRADLWKGNRHLTSPANRAMPRRWNRRAEARGVRETVFCGSMCDVFDNQVPKIWREGLFDLIRDTPFLDWLLLTKRPQNIRKMLPEDWGDGWPNVWLGTTVENRTELKRRAPVLAALPAAIRFWSVEPLLEDLGNLSVWLRDVDWVLVGGETRQDGRPRYMQPDWARSVRDQCRAAGVPFFMKQMTAKAPIPPDLMVRQFPMDLLREEARCA
jgi:protein gp37